MEKMEEESVSSKVDHLKLSSQRSKQTNSKKNEESLWDLRSTFKRNNLHIIGVLAESLFKEIMVEIFPNLGRDLDNQIHEGSS